MNQASALALDGDKDPMPIGRATPSGTLVRMPRRLMRAPLPDDEVLDSPKCDMRIGQPTGNGSFSFLRTAPKTVVAVEPGVWNAQVRVYDAQVLVSINNVSSAIRAIFSTEGPTAGRFSPQKKKIICTPRGTAARRST